MIGKGYIRHDITPTSALGTNTSYTVVQTSTKNYFTEILKLSGKQFLNLIKKSKKEYIPNLDLIKALYNQKCLELSKVPVLNQKLPKISRYKRINPYVRNQLKSYSYESKVLDFKKQDTCSRT